MTTGLINQKQNFAENVRNAIKYNDFDALVSALSSQIGRIAAKNKQDLVDMAKDAGLPAAIDTKDDDLFAMIASAMFKGNQKLITAILQYSVDKDSVKFENLTGIEEAIGAVANLGSSITNVFVQKEANKGKEIDLKGKRIDQQTAVLNAAALMKQSKDALAIEETRSSASTTRTIIIAGSIGFIFVIGTLAFIGYVRKNKNNAQK